MAQGMINQYQRQHGFGNRRRTNADTGIVPPFSGYLNGIALRIDRAARLGNRRGRLDGHIDDDFLAGRNTTEHTAGVITDETLRRHLVAMFTALLRHGSEAGTNFNPLDRIDTHHGISNFGIQTVINRLAPTRRNTGGGDCDLGTD